MSQIPLSGDRCNCTFTYKTSGRLVGVRRARVVVYAGFRATLQFVRIVFVVSRMALQTLFASYLYIRSSTRLPGV